MGAVRTLVDQIVKRDRLPSQHSLQAQRALRDAWNMIDECVYNAGYYKLLAKAAYMLCLLLGIMIIVLSVFKAQLNGTRELLSCQSSLLACFARYGKAAGGNCSAASHCTVDHEAAGILVTPTGIFVTASLLTMVRCSPTAHRHWLVLPSPPTVSKLSTLPLVSQ